MAKTFRGIRVFIVRAACNTVFNSSTNQTPKQMTFSRGALILLALVTCIGGYYFQKGYCETLAFSNCNSLVAKGYILNGAITLSILFFVGVFNRPKSLAPFFGFLLGTIIKTAGFFILMFPEMYSDETLTRPEFFTFFIPYCIALFWETFFLARISK